MPAWASTSQAAASSLPAGSNPRRRSVPTWVPAIRNICQLVRPGAKESPSWNRHPTSTRDGRVISSGRWRHRWLMPFATGDGSRERLHVGEARYLQRLGDPAIGNDVDLVG